MIVYLPTNSDYYDVHAVAGLAAGTSVVIHNDTASTLRVAISSTTPANDTNSGFVEPGETYSFSPKGSKLWVKGSTGPLNVDTLLGGSYASFERVDLPVDLYTSSAEGYRRLRVDTGQTGFFEGREFRTFFEINLASGNSRYFKFTSPVDFILTEQNLTLDSGAVRFTALTGATEAGTYATQLPVIGKNRMASRPSPYYQPQIAISTGGSATGGWYSS